MPILTCIIKARNKEKTHKPLAGAVSCPKPVIGRAAFPVLKVKTFKRKYTHKKGAMTSCQVILRKTNKITCIRF
ncbi:hypothetical protein GDO81_027555 [Engystomops pustulosus]|uniref:Uncharacterized protein n=1 Tax=Engystomops pustulosus TaxID=76066 RepID=A0AAV6YID3_ENGPU|nr:hypothetical protein GDO81_027555 [Engystomops pustulosus]